MRCLVAGLFLFYCSQGMTQALPDRQAEHNQAASEFLSTHFFENGRGMTLSPDLSIFFGGLKKKPSFLQDPIVIKRYGFVPGVKQRYVGVFDVKYNGINLAVLGCTGCHSGRAAGVLVPGLGNKTIDPYRIGVDLVAIQKKWGKIIKKKINKNDDYKYIHSKAMIFAKTLADPDISNLTRGLVPDSVIKTFFYRDTGTPYGPEIERTQVKVPSLWGFYEKRHVGVFADGSLSSENYAWAFGAELLASDSGDHLRASMPKLIHTVDNVMSKLLPPPYPFEIDQAKADRGRQFVEKNCFACHGDHRRDPEGFPIFEPPSLVRQDKVGTDPQRLSYANSLWVNLAESSSVNDLIKFNWNYFDYGYFAPKLWGIWSRFPYLHNGSVPTLYHMLVPPNERPEVFSMQDAGEVHRYDKLYAGLTVYRNPAMIDTQILKAQRGNRNLYWIGKEEHSNQGHYFEFLKDLNYDERMEIVEFLKTL